MKLMAPWIARWTFCLLLLAAVVVPQAHALDDFVPTGSMNEARGQGFTLTLLPNGKVLAVGGGGNVSGAELYDPATGIWTRTGSMNNGFYYHTATLLPNGKVLVAGGIAGDYSSHAELYDPATGLWNSTGSMSTARYCHTATLLPNGKVLVTGGYGKNDSYYYSSFSLSNAELYDPATGTWSNTGSMNYARGDSFTSTLLPNGKVLVAGGYNNGLCLSSAELYDPATGGWSTTGSMYDIRFQHTATLLPNGKVLVTGGCNNANGSFLSSAELYDPATGGWSATGSMYDTRFTHKATLLGNGKVLVAGGVGGHSGNGHLSSAELYDPATGGWSATGSMNYARFCIIVSLLQNGKVLVAGGDNISNTELYQGPPVMLSITGSPSSAKLNQGTSATFIVAATGTAPFSYQWRKNGADLVGATEATLTLNNVQPSDAGDYTVVVSNAAGAVMSDAATLTVLVPPSITAQPVGASLYLGDAITVAVTATGSGPLSYQWKKDGVDVAGANGMSLVLNPVLAAHAGSYTVVISNAAGSVTSNAAVVAATADLRDSDGDGLTNFDEVFVDHTNPNVADTDGDGLTDGYEAGIGRFSVVLGTFTWEQARVSAIANGGRLATFTSATEWDRALASLGAEALWDVNGLWIGANDAAVEGTWSWLTGEAFSFAPWATGQPDNLNNSDYAAVSGDLGGETGKWYDFRGVTTRDGYILEIGYTTDPLVADADGDGLNDSQEQAAGSNPFVADTDGDGLTDREEVQKSHTDPRLADSNSNGINDPADDADGDGLTNLAEIRTNLTNPVVADTDGDGLSDGAEFNTYHTNPLVADTDGDGYSDGYEVANASNPAVVGSVPTYTLTLTDGGVVTGGRFTESGSLAHGKTATLTVVANAGYVFDGWTGDLTGSTNPQTLLMNGNKTVGATFIHDIQDSDGEGLSNYDEAVIHGTNPNLADTDNDGLNDRAELETYHTNPKVVDSNGDDLPDGVAVALGLDPLTDHAAVAQTIRQTSHTMGLYSQQQLTDLRAGSTTVKVLPSAGGVQLRLKVQESADLQNWQDAGEAVYEQAADPAAPKKFFRIGLK